MIFKQTCKVINIRDGKVIVQSDAKQFKMFYADLYNKKRKLWDLQAQEASRLRRLDPQENLVLDGLVAYKKEDFGNMGGPLQKKKKGAKKQARKQAAREINALLRERVMCDCQATEHQLIGNCLQCGKIICELEGEGPCLFCGSLHERKVMNEQEMKDYEKAVEMNKKLLQFDVENTKRTTVLDDQEDHFSYQNKWLSKEERDEIKRKEEELEREHEENKKKIYLSIDIAGRQVIQQTYNQRKAEEINEIEKNLRLHSENVVNNSYAPQTFGNPEVPLVQPQGASTGLFINPFVEPQNAPKFVQPNGKVEIPKGKNLHTISAPETLSCVYNNNNSHKHNNNNINQNGQSKSKENDPKLQNRKKAPKVRVQNDWEDTEEF